jgi:hypothetical protein
MTCESSKSLKSIGHYILSAGEGTNTVQVVIWSKHIGWNGRGEVAPEFVAVSAVIIPLQRRIRADILLCGPPVSDIDHPLCVRVSVVALVGWSKMDLGLVKRVLDLIWEYAS